MNIQDLKAQVKAAQEANEKRIAEAAELATLQATLKLESSETLFNSKVKLAASSAQTKVLQELVDQCAAIVDSVPITNPKTRTARKWAASRRFTFGTQINLMYQLATGILYSCAEHKQLLLAHTGLDAELLEQVVESFGTPTYYSRNYNTVVDAKPHDLESVQAAIAVMQSELGVVVDTSLLTDEQFSLEFGRAQITAHENKAKAEEAIAEADFEI